MLGLPWGYAALIAESRKNEAIDRRMVNPAPKCRGEAVSLAGLSSCLPSFGAGEDIDCAAGDCGQRGDRDDCLQQHERLGASRQWRRFGRAEREARCEG